MLDDVEDIRVIERRMNAVGAVRQVLQAVWALARAQLPLAEAAAAEASEYLDWVDAIVDRLAGAPRREGPRDVLYVVLGPERPYCGALPRQILAQIPAIGALGIAGRRLLESAQREPGMSARIRFALPGAASHDEDESIADAVAQATLEHARRTHVELLYPTGGGSALRSTVLLAGDREAVPCPPETFSPWQKVLEAALREAVTGRIAVGLAETLRSEVRARVAAAEQAKNAANRKLEELSQDWRAARQQQITAELLELVAGRQASRAAGLHGPR